MATFEEYNTLIENTLNLLGLNPEEARSSEPGQWVVYNGDTEIYIDLWEQKEANGWMYFKPEGSVFIFQVISPVCILPKENREKLFEELLHNNLNMLYSSYTISTEENILAVKFRRVCDEIRREDIVEAIEATGFYSETTFSAISDRYAVEKIILED